MRIATVQRLQIEADEPPIYRIIDILWHNELMKAEGYDPAIYPDYFYEVGPIRRFFAPFFDVAADSVKGMGEPKSMAC